MAFRNPITSLPGTAITGPINGAQLVTGSVSSSALAVGSVTTNKLAAGAITGQTITGGMIQTSTSGARIVIDGPSDTESIYDSAGDVTGYLGGPNGIIGNYAPGDNEFSALANGSVYVGLGMPANFVTSGAGVLATLGDGSTVLQGGQILPAQTEPASLHLIPGVNGTDPPGSANLPRILAYDVAGGNADVLLSSAAIRSDRFGTLETWHAPAYGSGWAGATTYQTLGGDTLKYRLMGEDDLWLYGLATTAAAGSGTTVLTLPPGFRPAAGFTPHAHLGHSSGGVQSLAEIAVTSAGLVIINSTTRAAGDAYSFDCRIPLRNVL
jgi:hypothetical protein